MTAYLITAIIIFVISLVLFLVLKRDSGASIKNRKAFLYLLIFGIIGSVPGLIGMVTSVTESVLWFVMLQILYLILGIFYYFLLKREFFGSFEDSPVAKLSLVLANASLSFIGFTYVFNYVNGDGIGHLYATSTLLFAVPVLFMETFAKLASVPPEIHKIWYYPVNEQEVDLDRFDLNKIFLIELEVAKSKRDDNPSSYKGKAPVDMKFGDWFRSYINDFNYRFEEDPIHYLNERNQPFGWMFFTKSTFWKPKRFVDPDISFRENKLNDRTVIIAKRVEIEEE